MTGDAAAVALLEARVDKLTQALLHLAGELWVARDRQAVLERLLADAGLPSTVQVDRFRPDAALAQTLAAQREAFLVRLLALLAPDT